MARYADPRFCPDCHQVLPVAPATCPSCGLPLRHPLVAELFSTLQHADALLVDLRASAAAPVGEVAPSAEVPLPERDEPTPARPRRTGLRATSVPGLLLGLGALCLLVAAVTFLAVAWSWLGVGGRTAVLLGLTATAAGLGVFLDRRGLRLAAEALTTVALGLVVLDVVGADTAGWLGDASTRTVSGAVGLAVALVAAVLLASPGRLVAAQVAVPVGAALAVFGIPAADDNQVVPVVGVLLMAGLVLGGGVLAATVLRVVAIVLAAGWWLHLLGLALTSATEDPTLSAFWLDGAGLDGAGLGLLVASALLLVPLALTDDPAIRLLAVTAAAVLLTLSVAVPVTDESLTAAGLAALSALLVWSAITLLLPRRWVLVGAGPLVVAAAPALTIAAGLALEAAGRVLDVRTPFTADLGVRLGPADPWAHPLLLVGLVTGLLVAAGAVIRSMLLPAAGAAVLVPLAALGTLASYDVPLGLVVAGLAVMALALAAGTVRIPLGPVGVTSGALAVVTAAAALPSAGLTLAAAAVALGVAGLLLVTRTLPAVVTGELLLPAALAGGLWTLGEVTGLDTAVRALPVLVAVGALALVRPRAVLEAAAAFAGALALVASVDAAADEATSLAVHLTVAGALVTASALLNPGRRLLGWPGGLLLAAATWVRLGDLGVEAPEPYTMPTAVALVLFGLHRLWRDPRSASRVLAPGLTLATVPSLLWVLVGDPVSVRAVLLGGACLALVLGGTRLGWSTPVAVGGAVGALLVLRELAPYAQATPQWVMIGLAGIALTVVGVTWERRLLELRRAATYLGRLR